ncbi:MULTISPECIES: VWA domain-containing protein [unclassified Streptomyces]|uniref:VWA domain-containing protein n=1 Tax=unclassified Streptomyces TaxID=2593676 RepID=UPI002948BD01|nr:MULTISPECIES: VWA domain-containing protein [unclassified Streptomyces]
MAEVVAASAETVAAEVETDASVTAGDTSDTPEAVEAEADAKDDTPVAEAGAPEATESVEPAVDTTTDAVADAPADADVVTETEPVAEVEPVTVDEPVAEAEPKAGAAETSEQPEAEAVTEPVTETATEPEAVNAADTDTDTTDTAATAAATATAAEETEPVAEAEPEAVAVPESEPTEAPEQPEAQVTEAQATEPEATTHQAPAPTPALPLPRLKALAPHLADAYKAAGAQLRKQGLVGSRAAVYLVVDRSGSMRGYFKDGSVQRLAEQVTALAAHLDESASVTTVFFSTDIDGTVELTPATLTPTHVEEVNATLGRLGRTNYHRAVEEVLAHHAKEDPTRPALVVFQTDGAPESKTAAAQALAEAADRPLHWRFVAWGEADNKAFDFVRKLDGTPRTATFLAGATPVETAHPAFYRGLLAGLEF